MAAADCGPQVRPVFQDIHYHAMFQDFVVPGGLAYPGQRNLSPGQGGLEKGQEIGYLV